MVQWVKNLPANSGDTREVGLIPGLGKTPRVGNGNPLQYSCLENSMNRGVCWVTVHGVAELDKTEHTYMHNKEVHRIKYNQSVLDTFF